MWADGKMDGAKSQTVLEENLLDTLLGKIQVFSWLGLYGRINLNQGESNIYVAFSYIFNI